MNTRTKIIYIVTSLTFINFLFCQIDETTQQTTSGIISILEYFGIQIKEPIKALILMLIPIIFRFFEKKHIVNEYEQTLFENGIETPKRKSLFRKLWEKIRYRKHGRSN